MSKLYTNRIIKLSGNPSLSKSEGRVSCDSTSMGKKWVQEIYEHAPRVVMGSFGKS